METMNLAKKIQSDALKATVRSRYVNASLRAYDETRHIDMQKDLSDAAPRWKICKTSSISKSGAAEGIA
jgi:hypothetical protein